MGLRGILFAGLLFISAHHLFSQSQPDPGKLLLGFNYGMGTQNAFPFDSKNYTYKIRFYKGIMNLGIDETRKWSFEGNFELGYYNAKYQSYYHKNQDAATKSLLNIDSEIEKQLHEFVLNIGLVSRYKLSDHIGIYALGSIGPMMTSCSTDRLAQGFAFSDIFAFGLRYSTNYWAFDLRYGLRHVSNAGLLFPNKGYNSTNLEAGFLVRL